MWIIIFKRLHHAPGRIPSNLFFETCIGRIFGGHSRGKDLILGRRLLTMIMPILVRSFECPLFIALSLREWTNSWWITESSYTPVVMSCLCQVFSSKLCVDYCGCWRKVSHLPETKMDADTFFPSVGIMHEPTRRPFE